MQPCQDIRLLLEQELKGFTGVLEAAAGFVFGEQALVYRFSADIVDLIGEPWERGVDADGDEVVIDLVEQVAESSSVSVAGANKVVQAFRKPLLDCFFKNAAAHDGRSGE